ncbi:MAG TPA: ABC transporter permease [Casimicrobiaceae bacterium]|nr:ABC transporter permease [Casimicrobiaceae bacterium]
MGRSLLWFVGRRLLQLVPVIVAIAALNFVLVHLAPGDVAQLLAGQSGQASAEYVNQLRHEFGLDRPLLEQFLIYLDHLARFDLGYSYVQQTPVLALIADRLPATLLLMVSAITLALGLGIAFGVAAARRFGSLLDNMISVGALVVYATPVFWLGLILIVLFSVDLRLLPPDGMTDTRTTHTGLAYALDVLRHLVLPAITLALFYVAVYARLMRSAMLEVLGRDFITAARAKGLAERTIAWSHAAPNAILPVVTIAGVMFGNMLGGSILVETVFGWPGLGRLIFDALLQRDLNLLLGILFVSSLVVVAANLLVDLAYGLLDPRIVHQ